MRDVEGLEPSGSSLLTIAVLDQTGCGKGAGACGYIGRKGIEIEQAGWVWKQLKDDLDGDALPTFIVHEMAHNFDVFEDYLGYLSYHPHAWTEFMEPFVITYSRMGTGTMLPEDFQWRMLQFGYERYIRDSEANWNECVRNEACKDGSYYANRIWGGIMLRLAQVNGPESIGRFFTFLKSYMKTHHPPGSAEQKEFLHIEAMAAGARLDLGCYLDAWRWYTSPELRSRLGTYPENKFCLDLDGDELSPLAGDCNDRNPLVGPGVEDVPNQSDDNCNILIDDRLYEESSSQEFPDTAQGGLLLELPAQVRGKFATIDDSDFFRIRVRDNDLLYIRLCTTTSGSAEILYGIYGISIGGKGECLSVSRPMRHGGEKILRVIYNSPYINQPGEYYFEIDAFSEWPVQWAATAAPACRGGAYQLTSTTRTLVYSLPRKPTRVRYWVTGLGIVGTVPYATDTSLPWSPPGTLASGWYGYRVQAMAGSTPITDFSALQWFRMDPCK